MKSNITKLSAAAILLIALLITFVGPSSPAWAIEESIKALEGLKGVHITGVISGESCEFWMRADKAQKHSDDVLVITEKGNVNLVRDNVTYTYLADENKVYFENARTAGFSQWPGPKLFEFLSKVPDCKTHYEKDHTGRKIAIFEASITDIHGPESWLFEFDAETKMPVSLKNWPNLYQMGPPAFWAKKITYYKELSDEVFEFDFPSDAQYVEKPLTVPEEILGYLNNPGDGISAEGLTQLQACREILSHLWQAVINNDLAGVKRLCPLAKRWGDELIKYAFIRQGKDDQIIEVLEIGTITKVGNSKLGPLFVVPSRLKCKDQTVWKEDMIIQFRRIDGISSCVIHGPYGLTTQIE